MFSISESTNLIRRDSESTVLSSDTESVNLYPEQADNTNTFNHQNSSETNIRIDGSQGIQVGDVINNIRSTTQSASASVRLPVNDDVTSAIKGSCKNCIILQAVMFGVSLILFVAFVTFVFHKIGVEEENDRKAFSEFQRTTETLPHGSWNNFPWN